MPADAHQEDLAARLRRAGIRPTRQRLDILAELALEPHDATAQLLYQRLRGRGGRVGLATVYRTLGALARHGVVDALNHRAGEACYRLCSDEHHHHLVCSECHCVVELADCDVDGWVDRVTAAAGFTPTSHHLEVIGVCGDCRAEQ